MSQNAAHGRVWKNAGIALIVGGLLGPICFQVFFPQADRPESRSFTVLGVLQIVTIAFGIICFLWGRKQSRAPSERRRFSITGTAWQSLGLLLMVGAFPVFIALFALFGPKGRDYFLPILLLGVPLIGVGRYCYQRGKKHKVPSGAELMRSDARPPVLYLRSFIDDAAAAANPVWRAFFSPGAWTYALVGEEEQVAEVMNEIGPFVAIGRPGSKLPDLGAARMYVGESEWHAKVLELTARARLVVFRLGNTPGFWWEIRTVVGMLPPEKIVFLLPYGKARYEAFRVEADKYLPRPLPGFPVGAITDVIDRVTAGSDGLGTLKALLRFEPDWRPRLQLLSASPATIKGGKKLVANLKAAMDPMVKELGITWNKPPQFEQGRPFISIFDLVLGIPLVLAFVFIVWLFLRSH